MSYPVVPTPSVYVCLCSDVCVCVSYTNNEDPFDQRQAEAGDGPVAARSRGGQTEGQEEPDPVEEQRHWTEGQLVRRALHPITIYHTQLSGETEEELQRYGNNHVASVTQTQDRDLHRAAWFILPPHVDMNTRGQ